MPMPCARTWPSRATSWSSFERMRSAAMALSTPALPRTEVSACSRHSSLFDALPHPCFAQAAISSGVDCRVKVAGVSRPTVGESARAAAEELLFLGDAHCDAAIDTAAQAATSARLFRLERMAVIRLRCFDFRVRSGKARNPRAAAQSRGGRQGEVHRASSAPAPSPCALERKPSPVPGEGGEPSYRWGLHGVV